MKFKKLLSLVMALCAALLTLSGCATATTSGSGTGTSTGFGFQNILMIVALIAVFYFFAIRPESKRRKKAQEMRNSIEVGDSIVTVGGMIGKVVFVNDEKLTFETGEDRVRIEVQKWAVSENKGKGGNKDKGDSEESLEA